MKIKIIGIYAFFDKITKECLYLGLSSDVEQRRKNHMKQLRNGSHRRKLFVEWWKEHGEEESCLIFEVLEECSKEDLNEREMYYFYKLSPTFYGKKPSLKGKWSQTESTRKSISEGMRKFYQEKGTSRDVFLICDSCQGKFKSLKKAKFCSSRCSSDFRKGRQSKVSKELLNDLYWNKEMTKQEVANHLKISRGSVDNLMNDFEIKRRTMSEAQISLNRKRSGKGIRRTTKMEKKQCPLCQRMFAKNAIKRHQESCFRKL